MSWASSSFAPPSPSPHHMRPPHSFPLHTVHLAQALFCGQTFGTLCLQWGSPDSLASPRFPSYPETIFPHDSPPCFPFNPFSRVLSEVPCGSDLSLPFLLRRFLSENLPPHPSNSLPLGLEKFLFIAPDQSCGADPSREQMILFRKVISMGHKGLRNAGVGGLGSGSDSSSLVSFQGEIE